MGRVIERYTFLDGKRLYKDKIEYASGDFVLASDYEKEIASRDAQIFDLKKHIEKLTEVNKILNKLNKDNQRDSGEHEKYMDESIAISGKTPIEVAEMLINNQTHFEMHGIFPAHDNNTFSVGELEEIADYLKVYCKHNRGE